MTATLSDWRLRAACRTTDPAQAEIFYTNDADTMALARRICRGCAVREECLIDDLAAATGRHTIHGIRGGMNADYRRSLYRCVTGQCSHRRHTYRILALRGLVRGAR